MNTTCVVCQRREVEQPQVCTTCHPRIDALLAEIPDLIAEATQLTTEPDVRRGYRLVGHLFGCANRIEVFADPVAALTPSGPTGTPGRIRVAGTREAPLPISLDLLDLIGPGSASVTDPHGDQDGHLPPLVWLHQWVGDWAEMLGFRLPLIGINELVTWLRSRLHWACAHHPAIDEFASELRQQVGRLRAAAGVTPERPELCSGVACQHCDARNLWRLEGRVHCGSCGKIYERDEYDGWVREQAAKARKVAA